MKIIKLVIGLILIVSLSTIVYGKLLDLKLNKAEINIVAETTQEDFFPSSIDATTEMANGECWRSIASHVDHAYRCSVIHTIYDPCFKIADTMVACYSDPEEVADIVITTQKPLEDREWSDQASWLSFAKGAESYPWFAILADETRCQVLTGTPVPIDGIDYYFACTNFMDKNMYGEINIETNPWRMRLADYTRIKPDMYVNIIKIYK